MDIKKKGAITAVLIGAWVLVFLIAAWIWQALPEAIKILVCGAELGLVAAIYWRLRPHKQLNESLKESHYEKFRRLEGIYLTIPDAVRNRPENKAAVEEFEKQRARLETWVSNENKAKTFTFTRDDAPDFVHNLYLALLQIVPVDFLHFSIQSVESEYRQAVGPSAYDAYLGALMRKPNDPSLPQDERDRLLRSEAIYLVNETRRQQLLRQHAQSTREGLLHAAFRSWLKNILPLVAVLSAFFLGLSWVKTALETNPQAGGSGSWTTDVARKYLLVAGATAPDKPENPPMPFVKIISQQTTPLFKMLMTAALLALAGIAGATGGMMSVIQRVQASVPESDALTDLLALSQAETAVSFAPVTGLIFALVLSLFFAGKVLSGSVFPPSQGFDSDWYLTLFSGTSLAVWLLWAFLAGFSERLVPDELDNLVKQQSSINSKATPPAGARNVPTQTPENANAGNGNRPQIGQLTPNTIQPPSSSSQAGQTIEVTGKGLANVSKATLIGPDNAGKNDVANLSGTKLLAEGDKLKCDFIIPSNVAIGDWKLRLETPDGDKVEKAFSVLNPT